MMLDGVGTHTHIHTRTRTRKHKHDPISDHQFSNISALSLPLFHNLKYPPPTCLANLALTPLPCLALQTSYSVNVLCV